MKSKIIITWLLIQCASIFSSDNDTIFYKNLTDKLSLYNEKFPMENVYVQLDKSVYKAGDDLWFKAFISETQKNVSGNLSKGLTVMIFNVSGKTVFAGKYLIENSAVNGDLILPSDLDDGMYTFIAYSSWMENGDVDRVFRKFIEINNSKSGEFNISVSTVTNYYLYGLPYKIKSQVQFSDGRPIEDQKIKLTAGDGNNNFIKTEVHSNNDGQADFEITVPANQKKVPLFITCEARVGKNTNHATIVVYPQPEKINLNFFPEGGSIIAGIRKLVVVSAKDINGKPIAVEGKIINNNGTVISLFSTSESGYGRFHLLSQPGNKFHAQITKPSGISQDYLLPEIKNDGISLALFKKENDTAIFKVETNWNDEVTELKCITHSLGNIFWAGSVAIKSGGLIKVFIGNQPSGIYQFVVFNNHSKVLAQRLFFIDNKPSVLEVDPDNSFYSEKAKVSLNIKLKNIKKSIINSNLALSVCKLDLYDTLKNVGIKTSSFLNPELDNLFYFSELDKKVDARDNIDILLIANSFWQFNWSKVLQVNPDAAEYITKDGLSGLVLDKKGEPVSEANVAAVNPATLKLFQTTSDKFGWFNIPTIDLGYDELSYSPTAVTKDGNKKANVYLVNKFEEELKLLARTNPYFINPVYNYFGDSSGLKKIDDLLVTQSFLEIRNRERSKLHARMSDQRKKELLSPSKSLLEVIQELKPYKIVNNKIMFAGYNNSILAQTGARFVIDHVLMSDDISIANSINVADIENINIITDPNEILRYTPFANGIVEITTKTGGQSEVSVKFNSNKRSYYKLSRKYSGPEYSQSKTTVADNRTTLIWEPSVIFNNNGETTITYYNSDVKGNFIGTLEGFVNGEPVSASFRYDVK